MHIQSFINYLFIKGFYRRSENTVKMIFFIFTMGLVSLAPTNVNNSTTEAVANKAQGNAMLNRTQQDINSVANVQMVPMQSHQINLMIPFYTSYANSTSATCACSHHQNPPAQPIHQHLNAGGAAQVPTAHTVCLAQNGISPVNYICVAPPHPFICAPMFLNSMHMHSSCIGNTSLCFIMLG